MTQKLLSNQICDIEACKYYINNPESFNCDYYNGELVDLCIDRVSRELKQLRDIVRIIEKEILNPLTGGNDDTINKDC